MAGPGGTLMIETLRDPQGVARRLIAADLPVQARWMAAALVAVLAVIGLKLALWIAPEAEPTVFTALGDPRFGLPVQFTSVLLLSIVMVIAGRVQGGAGQFLDALVLVTWIEFLMLAAQVLQIFSLLILPPLSMMISIASLVLFFWLMVQFTAALHGLTALGRVFLALVAGFFAVLFLVAVLAGLFGFTPQPTGA